MTRPQKRAMSPSDASQSLRDRSQPPSIYLITEISGCVASSVCVKT